MLPEPGEPYPTRKPGEPLRLTSTLNPYPAIAVSTIGSSPPGQCDWINTGLSAFTATNPANSSGPSGMWWSFTWAGAAAEAQVEAGISILDYYPFVAREPDVIAGNGTNFPGEAVGELGGAVFNLRYTPQPGAPVITNLHWIQALTGIRRGTPVPTILDTGPAYTSQSTVTPFYDTAAAARTNASGGGWFLDTPFILENEYETNPVASVQFQVILASDIQTVSGGVTNNAVTLYGGEWWGFTFSAMDVPEPSACLLVTLGGIGLLFRRRIIGKKRAA